MSIRLPTFSQHIMQAEQISRQYDRVTVLQNQVSSGKKLQQSSDDSLLASQIKSIETYMERLEGYELNTNLAVSQLAMSGSVLQQGSDLIIRAQQLMVQAGNGAYDDSDRRVIAGELNSILNSFLDLANTRDGNGEYIFNGCALGPAYVRNGNSFEYQGTYEGYSIAINDQASVLYKQSGFSVFGDIKSGNGVFSVSADPANQGTGVIKPIIVSSGNVIKDEYSVTFVTNSMGKLAYQVTDVNTSEIVVPANFEDPPEYVADSSITFNGLTAHFTGEPKLGDTFTITPSHTQNIFQTLQNLIDVLSTPQSSPGVKTQLRQILFEETSSLDTAFDHFLQETTSLGARARQVDEYVNLNNDIIFQQKQILSSLSSVDLPSAISNMTMQLTSLEMSQQSYMKIQELFSRLLSQQF
jgi:flagellar hook-associated protein 3 FlgL